MTIKTVEIPGSSPEPELRVKKATSSRPREPLKAIQANSQVAATKPKVHGRHKSRVATQKFDLQTQTSFPSKTGSQQHDQEPPQEQAEEQERQNRI